MKDDRDERALGGAAVRPSRRGRRRLRRTAIAVALLLALVGAASIQRFFFGRPGVGHFRSVEGRAAYVEAYGHGMSALPPPTATYDVVTDLGTVRAYEWSSPAVTETVPVVLVPGRSSGVPMWSENLPGFLTDHRVIAFDALGDAGLSVQGAPMESFEDQALWMQQVLTELAPLGSPPRRPLLRRRDCRDLRAPLPRPRGLADAPRTGLHLRVPSRAPHGMGDALVPAGPTRPGAQLRPGQGGRSRVRPERRHGEDDRRRLRALLGITSSTGPAATTTSYRN